MKSKLKKIYSNEPVMIQFIPSYFGDKIKIKYTKGKKKGKLTLTTASKALIKSYVPKAKFPKYIPNRSGAHKFTKVEFQAVVVKRHSKATFLSDKWKKAYKKEKKLKAIMVLHLTWDNKWKPPITQKIAIASSLLHPSKSKYLKTTPMLGMCKYEGDYGEIEKRIDSLKVTLLRIPYGVKGLRAYFSDPVLQGKMGTFKFKL